MIQALAISLAVVLAFALPAFAETKPPPRKSAPILIYDHEAPQKPGKALKAKTGAKKGPQIQLTTSDLTNADTLRSQNKKTKGVKSK